MASELIKNKLKGWTVLVVDDEPDSLFVAARWLKLAGATVLSAENGKDGLELARLMQPRFILTDLTMPVMDGWEFQYELRRDPGTQSIPVIALTAHAMSGIREQVLTAGFFDHIPKPLSPTKFLEQVLGILERIPHLQPLLAAE
jgi:two-component system, cell cycle response regulator DivK